MKLNDISTIMNTVTKYSFYKDEFDALYYNDVYTNNVGGWTVLISNDDGQGNVYYYVIDGNNYNILEEERFTDYFGKNQARDRFNKLVIEM